MPTERQVLGAKILAAKEAFVDQHKKPWGKGGGGWLVPSTEDRYAYLSEKFGLMPRTLSFFMTYSRSCEHPWSEGACAKCPAWDHFPLI